MFNPFEEWITSNRESFQVRYCSTVPFVREAVLMLSSAGIEVNVRYMPFCLSAGFENHVMNFPQLVYDEWEWNYKDGTPNLGEYDHLLYQLRESRSRYDQGPACARCSFMLICSGVPKQYDRVFGWGELHPQEGMLIRDPLHFKSFKASTMMTGTAASHIALSELVAMYPSFRKPTRSSITSWPPWTKRRHCLVVRALHGAPTQYILQVALAALLWGSY